MVHASRSRCLQSTTDLLARSKLMCSQLPDILLILYRYTKLKFHKHDFLNNLYLSNQEQAVDYSKQSQCPISFRNCIKIINWHLFYRMLFSYLVFYRCPERRERFYKAYYWAQKQCLNMQQNPLCPAYL